MKYCPNPDCPHVIDVGSPAEFLEEIQVCSDCGTRLRWVEESQAAIPGSSPDAAVPWVLIATFMSSLEAAIAKGRLGAEGIGAMFLNEHNANTEFCCYWGNGEIKLVVKEADAPAARELLAADYSGMVPDKNAGPRDNG